MLANAAKKNNYEILDPRQQIAAPGFLFSSQIIVGKGGVREGLPDSAINKMLEFSRDRIAEFFQVKLIVLPRSETPSQISPDFIRSGSFE